MTEKQAYKKAKYILTELNGSIIEDEVCKELGHWGQKGYILVISGDFYNMVRIHYDYKKDYERDLKMFKSIIVSS